MGIARAAFFGVLIAAFIAWLKNNTDLRHFQIQWFYPYALLFTTPREITLKAWERFGQVDTSIEYSATQVPEIDAKDYTFEAIKKATDNFRYPAVVRGLFNGVPALTLWNTSDYLNKHFGHFEIPIVRNATVGTFQDDRVLVKFDDAFNMLYTQDYAKEYIFFPVKSRFSFNGSTAGSAQELQAAVDDICRQDLELHRLWPGFAGKQHKTYVASQLIVGKSTIEITEKSTGSDWHCAIGNNWFVQVSGIKRWEFIDPIYSAYLSPLKGGFFNMWTGNLKMKEVQKHIPRRTVTLYPGDMVYNPDWMWHKITNYGGGLTIGVPIRESNFSLSFQNNFYFTSIVITNKLLSLLGTSLGGYPAPTAATEQDN